MTIKAITPDQIEGLEETEKKAASKLSKTARQKRRADLGNPSTISRRLSSMLAEAFPPEVIVEKIKELMNAEVVTKGGQVRPDTRTQESAVKLLLNYTVGLPVIRSENIMVNVNPSAEDVQAKIDHSPALRQQLAVMIGAELK
jgi:hypothetical protein